MPRLRRNRRARRDVTKTARRASASAPAGSSLSSPRVLEPAPEDDTPVTPKPRRRRKKILVEDASD